MKEQITKFDLEAAFKALDEIDVPQVKGIRANRLDLSESIKPVDRTSMLVEEYFDLNDKDDLQEASEERDAEVAKAKLARIEKIVDLDAESEEDILPSYVGKTIVQCPQCMTLFYKNPDDIVQSEDDPDVVNVNEICQHCGNDSGYTVIGKVAEEEVPVEEVPMEEPAEETPAEEPASEEELPEEEPEEKLELEEIPDESAEENKKEEANESLQEDLDTDMGNYNAYIDYIQSQIKADEKELKKAGNNQLIKDAIQKKLDAHKADLESALPPVVKDAQAVEELPTPEEAETNALEGSDSAMNNEDTEAEKTEETKSDINNENSDDEEKNNDRNESLNNSTLNEDVCKDCKKETTAKVCIKCGKTPCECEKEEQEPVIEWGNGNSKAQKELQEAEEEPVENKKELKFSTGDIDKMLNSAEFKKPVSEEEVESYLAAGDDQKDIEEGLFDTIKDKFTKKDSGKGSASSSKKQIPSGTVMSKAHSWLNSFANESDVDGTRLKLKAYIEKEFPSNNFEMDSDARAYKLTDGTNYSTPWGVAEAAFKAWRKKIKESLEDGNETDDKVKEEVRFEEIEELDEAAFNNIINSYLTEVYSNVKNFKLTSCEMAENYKLIVEGTINFNSGKARNTTFEFIPTEANLLEGYSEEFSTDEPAFSLKYSIMDTKNKGKVLMTENLDYKYNVNDTKVHGSTGK